MRGGKQVEVGSAACMPRALGSKPSRPVKGFSQTMRLQRRLKSRIADESRSGGPVS